MAPFTFFFLINSHLSSTSWKKTKKKNLLLLLLNLGIRRCCFSSSSTASAVQYNHQNHSIARHTALDFRQWNRTISHLIRTGRLHGARRVFDEMPQRNVITWNSMIRGYVQSGELVRARKLFDEMPERDVVSWNVMISGYVSCRGSIRHIDEGRYLFDRMPRRDPVSWNTMISGYARSGRMEDALSLFNQMPERNVVSWNAMITGFLHNGDVRMAIETFERMPNRDSASLSALVSGLIQNGKLEEAEEVLVKTRKVNGEVNIIDAYNTLVAGYGQTGRVEKARKLFDHIPFRKYQEEEEDSKMTENTGSFERNIISWNSMIMCYIKAGDTLAARQLFDEMPERDVVSWNTMISGYVHTLDMEGAESLFDLMSERDTRSWNSMISGYAQSGELETARDFFERMPQKSLVSWNSMLAGYEQNADYESAMAFFIQMQSMGEKPDRHTYSSVLGACAALTALNQGMQIHQRVTKTVIADVPIKNALITMYARCGNIMDARSIFDNMKTLKDVVSWNAMIGGYAQHGCASEALELFGEMKAMKVWPTYITFISVLNACAHAGLVAEGRRQFDSMVHDFGIAPRVEHFASLVDVIGRHGQVKDAMELIATMPVKPDGAVWGALLGACRVHNDLDLARVAAEALMLVEPESSAPYVLLYNMYADARRWDDATELRTMMEDNNIRKQPGYSWIELHSRVHVFVAGDQSHPNAADILALLESCNRVIKDLDSKIQHSLIFAGE
ncbi:hypothetical protein AAC387_Pa04g2979 [Persea americana]